MVSLVKVIIPVLSDSHVALIDWENEDVGVDAERVKCRFFRFGEVVVVEGG